MIEDVAAAIGASTIPAAADSSLPRARFAMLVRATDDPQRKAAEIAASLAPLGATLRQLSPVETDVLVATFADRAFGVDDARAFAAAHVIRETFDLEQAEPDLPTNVYPEQEPPSGQKDPTTESVQGLCFTDAQPELAPRWALDAMRVQEAWAFSDAQQRPSRGAAIVIAQPDTGVTDHGELAGVDRVAPRDVLDDDGDPTDPLEDVGNPGHGTGTGSVAVSREDGVVAGAAPLASHMPIRAIKSVVRITQVSVAEAIEWAVDNGAHVITMSLGGLPSFSLHRALKRAVATDVIVLAAAGNCVRTVVFPARYDECIGVAGVNSSDQAWKGTCRGPSVAISAPGENVFKARIGEPAIGQGQGTSFAVALTAGTAALWLAHHGRENLLNAAHARGETLQAMFRRLVRATARRPDGWDSSSMGAGIVDARALLEADLDLDRGLESAPQVQTAGVPSAAVQSMVAETLGEEAVVAALDWTRHGPEIALAVLRSRLTPVAAAVGTEAAAAPTPAVSPQLAADAAGSLLLMRMRAGV